MSGFDNIRHVVVVMMENRSFDSLLGWLYTDTNNSPPHNVPDRTPPTFDGLLPNTFSNKLGERRVFAKHPPGAWPPKNNPSLVPDPDPHEEFDHITHQIFGTTAPAPGAKPDMGGFLSDYADLTQAPDQIMESFGPNQAKVINELARNFAVCDRWFASCPCQTWPNRGFVHTGSSDGHINNDNYELYDVRTIFNVLEDRRISWGVFHDSTLIPSLTWGQFLPRLLMYRHRFYRMTSFFRHCAALNEYRLPAYSFLEPRFMPEFGLFRVDYPQDYHPPHNVCRGEHFLADIYNAVRTSPYREQILLVITYDEHGGCYDHVPPPGNAAPPGPYPVSRDGRFHFDRFGVRVPAIVISEYVRPGTVFRAPDGSPPYDHTSILATLRDLLPQLGASVSPGFWAKFKSLWSTNRPEPPFLLSPRIQSAPTLEPILSLSTPNKTWPETKPACQIDPFDATLDTRLSDVQRSLLATAKRKNVLETGAAAEAQSQGTQLQTADEARNQVTYANALQYLHPESNPQSPPHR
jgi:phospholipase C